MKILISIFFIIALCCNVFTQTYNLEKLDSYFQKCFDEWEIPGAAVGIVKNDTVIFAKGYGVREINKPGKVGTGTMFGIASNTKAFTAAALGILADEGKIVFDDKVIKYLPYFKMYAPFVSEEFTIRDLLSHRSGLATFSGDLLWYASNYSRTDIIKRIQYLKPVTGFRSKYGYSNVLYLTAGEIIPVVTGKSYDEFVGEKLFGPLQMKNTNTSITKQTNYDDVASPHVRYNGKITPVKYINWDNIAPAGGINSTVDDMCKWLRMLLNKGTLNNHLFITEKTLNELWSPQTVHKLSRFDEYMFPKMHFQCYGLGWNLADYHGRKIISHGGGLDGMITQVCVVPEEKLGIVIFTNSTNYLPRVLMFSILDEFLGADGKDYSNILKNLADKQEENNARNEAEKEEKRNKLSKPSLVHEKYCGTYGGDLYGDATITIKNGKLFIQFLPSPDFASALEHWQYDTFVVEFKNFISLPKGKVTFMLNEDGEVKSFVINVPNPDFDFTELEFNKKPVNTLH